MRRKPKVPTVAEAAEALAAAEHYASRFPSPWSDKRVEQCREALGLAEVAEARARRAQERVMARPQTKGERQWR